MKVVILAVTALGDWVTTVRQHHDEALAQAAVVDVAQAGAVAVLASALRRRVTDGQCAAAVMHALDAMAEADSMAIEGPGARGSSCRCGRNW